LQAGKWTRRFCVWAACVFKFLRGSSGGFLNPNQS
jgi:hypothetical protein